MLKTVGVGHKGYFNFSRYVAIVEASSSAAQKIISKAKEEGKLIDSTKGRKRKSIIIMDSNHVIISTKTPESVRDNISKTYSELNNIKE